MNPYFKEADNLFGQAIETLHKDGFDACQEIIDEVFRYEPIGK